MSTFRSSAAHGRFIVVIESCNMRQIGVAFVVTAVDEL
jgi:hypothetical protein